MDDQPHNTLFDTAEAKQLNDDQRQLMSVICDEQTLPNSTINPVASFVLSCKSSFVIPSGWITQASHHAPQPLLIWVQSRYGGSEMWSCRQVISMLRQVLWTPHVSSLSSLFYLGGWFVWQKQEAVIMLPNNSPRVWTEMWRALSLYLYIVGRQWRRRRRRQLWNPISEVWTDRAAHFAAHSHVRPNSTNAFRDRMGCCDDDDDDDPSVRVNFE